MILKILTVYVVLLSLALFLDLITKADKWPTPAKRVLLVLYVPAVLMFMMLHDLSEAAAFTWSEFRDTLREAWGGGE